MKTGFSNALILQDTLIILQKKTNKNTFSYRPDKISVHTTTQIIRQLWWIEDFDLHVSQSPRKKSAKHRKCSQNYPFERNTNNAGYVTERAVSPESYAENSNWRFNILASGQTWRHTHTSEAAKAGRIKTLDTRKTKTVGVEAWRHIRGKVRWEFSEMRMTVAS